MQEDLAKLALRIQQDFPNEKTEAEAIDNHGLLFVAEIMMLTKHPMIQLSRSQVCDFFNCVQYRSHRIIIQYLNKKYNFGNDFKLPKNATYDDIENFFIYCCDLQNLYDDGSLPTFMFNHFAKACSLNNDGLDNRLDFEFLWNEILLSPQRKFIVDNLNVVIIKNDKF